MATKYAVPVSCFEDKDGNLHRSEADATTASAMSVYTTATEASTTNSRFSPQNFLKVLAYSSELADALKILCPVTLGTQAPTSVKDATVSETAPVAKKGSRNVSKKVVVTLADVEKATDPKTRPCKAPIPIPLKGMSLAEYKASAKLPMFQGSAKVIRAKSKKLLLAAIREAYGVPNHLVDMSGKIAWHAQKFRKTSVSGEINPKTGKRPNANILPGYWEARVHAIPSGLRVVQSARTFKIFPKK